jgi:hypothetical protein
VSELFKYPTCPHCGHTLDAEYKRVKFDDTPSRKDFLERLMSASAVVKCDKESNYRGEARLSRGYYIVSVIEPNLYLHDDGKVRQGVKNSSTGKLAFWDSEAAALAFLANWIAMRNTPPTEEPPHGN